MNALKIVLVGLAATVVGYSTTRLIMGKDKDEDRILRLFNYFASAVILQLIFEFSGISSKICKLSAPK